MLERKINPAPFALSPCDPPRFQDHPVSLDEVLINGTDPVDELHPVIQHFSPSCSRKMAAVYQNILHIFARVLAIFPDPPLRFEVGAVVVMMES